MGVWACGWKLTNDQRSKMKDLKTQHRVSKKYIYILKWSSSKQILVVLVLGQLGVEGNRLTFGMWLDALSVRDNGAVSLLLLVRMSSVLYFPSLYLQQTTSTKNSVQLCIIPENNGKKWLTDTQYLGTNFDNFMGQNCKYKKIQKVFLER